MEGLNELEQAVLDRLLSGDHPALVVLRRQAERARVVAREETGVGFFCDFEVEGSAPALQGDFDIGDVYGELEGLAHGAGFVLFIRDGRLSMLEGFTYDEPWPKKIGTYTLKYMAEPRALSLPGSSPSARTSPGPTHRDKHR